MAHSFNLALTFLLQSYKSLHFHHEPQLFSQSSVFTHFWDFAFIHILFKQHGFPGRMHTLSVKKTHIKY